MRLQRLLLFTGGLFYLIVFAGCAGLGTDNAPKPTPLLAFQPAFTVQPLWSSQAGKGIGQDYLLLGPVVAANRLFIADAQGSVYALTTQSGSRLWQTQLKSRITSGPSVGANLLLVTTADAQVVALDPINGKILWHVAIPNQSLAAAPITADKVFIKTIDGKLCALAAQTGQILWIYDHGAPTLVLRAESAPQVIAGRVIVGFADGQLAALDEANGRLLWQQQVAQPQGATEVEQMVDIAADPKLDEGIVYVATYQGQIAAVALANGRVIWQQQLSSYTGLVLTDKLVIVTDAQGIVWALDRATGNIIWKQTQLRYRLLTAPVLKANTIIVGDGEGYLHWLAQDSGQVQARVLIAKKKAIVAPPVATGNTVYTVTQQGQVSAWQTG